MAKGRLIARINWPGTAVLVFVALAWEAIVRSGLLDYEYLPAPSAIARGWGELAREGLLASDIAHTLSAVAIGWTAAMVLGVSLGFLLGLSATARRYSLASIEILRPMPGVAFAPVALLLFGFSLKTEMVVTILPVLWPVLVNTMGGVTSVHQRLHDVGRTFRLSRRDTILRIVLPAAMPPIVAGARIGLGLALVLAVIAEMVGNPAGLGYGIVREQQALRPDLMFAYIVTVGLIGIALNAGMLALAEALLPSFRQLRGEP
ncbi:MAG: ABC transporter permease [Bradyrhizobium sp.]|uniref:ABC transporter permease n=1 Tax=Bradyrhizobium sp. TaxID=376 RepID=UPI001DCE0EC5|nr:ABC transporter permease [Bradyrhizobium sp.]MBV9566491.1 ABC transporter permease [Bradyrhizobium sp.]